MLTLERLQPPTPNEKEYGNWAEKKLIWVADNEQIYVVASVISYGEDYLTVKLEDGTVKQVHVNDTEKMNHPKFDKVEDMADLGYLNEASVLHNLRLRYFSNLIYTYSGLFLVAVNPYRKLPIYNEQAIQSYRNKRRNEAAPHIYAIADAAYFDMVQDRENQSILITGESGAGKTENTKKVIQYLTSISGENGEFSANGLEAKILQANPILESFGNAQTSRNNNSSRFGKFIRMEFNNQGKIAGANIQRYLLEKSRVTHQSPKERNYHIFYQLLKGASQELRDSLLLSDLRSYNYVNKSNLQIDGVDDVDEFNQLQHSLDILGFSKMEQFSYFQVVSAVLNLGNIMVKADRNDQAQLEDMSSTEKVCHLLGINTAEFVKGLLRPKIKAGRDWVSQSRTCEQVQYSIEALGRALYERMFSHLVDRMNQQIDSSFPTSTFIGVLDIAGFEIFETNSFEQLCINYTNEKLQQFFNHHMFVLEQNEYQREGIEWNFIDFGLDLEPTIALIEKSNPIGILSCLDEECVMPKANDKTFTEKLDSIWRNKSQIYESIKLQQGFKLHHYAGKVTYSTLGWLDKNKDPLNENISKLLSLSSDNFVASLFIDYLCEESESDRRIIAKSKSKKGVFRTVAQKHKEQLNSLMSLLYSTQPHFVRCILPNVNKKAGSFDSSLIVEQLRCNGVLEGIRICRQGFPSRMFYADLKQRYEILAPEIIPKGFMDGKQACELLLNAIEVEPALYRLGNSKVFFKAGVLQHLEEKRDLRLFNLMSSFQALCKGYLARKKYHTKIQQLKAIQIIQRNARVYVKLREWSWWKLYSKVKPLLNVTRVEEELLQKDEEVCELKQQLEKEIGERMRLQLLSENLKAEKESIETTLAEERQAALDQGEILERIQHREITLLDQIRDFTTEFEMIEKQIEDANGTKLVMESELNRLKEDIILKTEFGNKLEKDKASKDLQILELENEIAIEKENYKKIEELRSVLEDSLRNNEIKILEKEELNGSLSLELKNVKKQLEELEENSKRKDEDLLSLQSHRSKLETELREAEEKLMELEAKLARCELDLKKEKEGHEETNAIVIRERAEKSLLEKEKRELMIKLSSETEKVQAEIEKNKKLQEQTTRMENEINDLGKIVEAKGDEESKQNQLRKHREAELTELKKSLNSSQEEYERLKKSTSEMIECLNFDIQDLNHQYSSILLQKHTLEKKLAATEESQTLVQAELQNLQKLYRQCESELKGAKVDCDELSKELNTMSLSKENLESELSLSKAKLDEHDLKLAKLSREKSSLQRELEGIKEELASEKQRKNSLESIKNKLSEEVALLQQRVEETENIKLDSLRKLSLKSTEYNLLQEKMRIDELEKQTYIEDYKRKSEATIAELSNSLESLSKENCNLEKTKSRLVNDIEDMSHELDRVKSGQKAAERASKLLEEQLNQITQELVDEKTSQGSKSIKLEKLEISYSQIRKELEDKNTFIHSLQESKNEMERELKMLVEELGEENKKCFSLEKSNRKLSSDIAELSDQLSDEKETRTRAEEARSRLEELISTNKLQYEEEYSQKEKQQEENKKILMKEVASMSYRLEAETASKNEAIKAKKRLEAEVKSLTIEIEGATKNQTDSERARKKLETSLKEVQQQYEYEVRVRKSFEELVARHEKKVHLLSCDLEAADAKIDTLERSKRTLEKQNEDFTSELDLVVNEKEKLLEKMKQLSRENTELKEQIEEEERLKAEDSSRIDTSGELELAKSQIREEMEEKLDRLEESRKALTSANRHLEEELDHYKQTILSLEKEKRQALQEMEAMQEQLEREMSIKNEEVSGRRKLCIELNDVEMRLDTEIARANEASEMMGLYKAKAEQYVNKVDILEMEKLKQEKTEVMLKNSIKELEESLEESKNEVAKMEGENRALEKSIQEFVEKLEELSNELSDVVSAKRKLEDLFNHEKERNKMEEEEIKILVETTRRKYQKEIRELAGELEMEKANSLCLKETNKDLELELEEIMTRLEENASYMTSFEKEKEKVAIKYEEAQAQIEMLTMEQEKSSSQLEAYQCRTKLLQDELNEAESHKLSLEKSKRILEQKLEEVTENLNEATKKRQEVEKSASMAGKESMDLKIMLQEEQEQVYLVNERLQKVEASLNDTLAELKKQQDICNEHEHSKMLLEKKVKEMNIHIMELETASLSDASRNMARLETRVTELTASLGVASNEKSELNRQLRKLERQVRELQYQFNEVETMKTRKGQENERLEQKVKRMKEQLLELENSENSLQLSKRRVERELLECKEKSSRLEKEVEKLKGRKDTRSPFTC